MDRVKNILKDTRRGENQPSSSSADPAPYNASESDLQWSTDSLGEPADPPIPSSSQPVAAQSTASSSRPWRFRNPLPRSPPQAVITSDTATRDYGAQPGVPPVLPLEQQPSNPDSPPRRGPRMQRLSLAPTISLNRLPSHARLNDGTDRRDFSVQDNATDRRDAGAAAQDQGTFLRARNSIISLFSRDRESSEQRADPSALSQYDARMVDVLDTIDPEVQTLTSLTNVQNSLFVPDFGGWVKVNRRPTYSLTNLLKGEDPHVEKTTVEPIQTLDTVQEDRPAPPPSTHMPARRPVPPKQSVDRARKSIEPPRKSMDYNRASMDHPRKSTDRPLRRIPTVSSINSQMSDSRYAVLPNDTYLEGWSKEEMSELNDHVRHMLHSRRSKFKRSLKGFGQYVRRPLGFFVTLYATLITLFGLAWVLFLIGWIYVGEEQERMINIIDYTLVALFAIVGDGLIPWRIVDTYRMIHIARYHHLTRRIRRDRHLPDLHDENELPQAMPPPARVRYSRRSKNFMGKWGAKINPFKRSKPEEDIEEPYEEYSVLKAVQQQKLIHHQTKFAKQHTFYKPQETETHFAFPHHFFVAIVTLLDFHSIFQLTLGLSTIILHSGKTKTAVTTSVLCLSLTCNITAGIVIWVGGNRTRKKDVLERMNRQELTQAAIEKMNHKWEKEEQEAREREAEALEHRSSNRSGRH